MVWFPNLWFYLSGRKCIVAMFSCFKTKSQRKFTTQGLCISAMSHVELITGTKNMKSMRFFYSFLNVIAENFIKNVLLEMKNGLSLSQQQLQVIMYYIITWAFNNSVADKTNAHTPQKRSILFFFRCARCATQALLNRHDFFFWKMAADVAVVSCLSGLLKVHFRNVGHQVPLPTILPKKVLGYVLFSTQPDLCQTFAVYHHFAKVANL